MPPERWIFDVDACLVDSLTGTSLRPGARALLEHLRATSKTVVWWSAGGGDYARHRAEQLGVADLVDEFCAKIERDHTGRYAAGHVIGDSTIAVFVDDRPEDMPAGVVVIAVSPYLAPDPHDRGLTGAARRAGLDPAE